MEFIGNNNGRQRYRNTENNIKNGRNIEIKRPQYNVLLFLWNTEIYQKQRDHM